MSSFPAKRRTAIAGATQAAYTTPVLQTSDSGSTFDVVVTNSAGTVTSSAAKLTVTAGTAPTIVTQPAGASVSSGQPVTLSVVAAGSGPLHYQWLLNATTNVGTDSSTFPSGWKHHVFDEQAKALYELGVSHSDAKLIFGENLLGIIPR